MRVLMPSVDAEEPFKTFSRGTVVVNEENKHSVCEVLFLP